MKVQRRLKAFLLCFGLNANDHLGWSVSNAFVIVNNFEVVVVGAPYFDNGSIIDVGKAYVVTTYIPEYPSFVIPILFYAILVAGMTKKIRKSNNENRKTKFPQTGPVGLKSGSSAQKSTRGRR